MHDRLSQPGAEKMVFNLMVFFCFLTQKSRKVEFFGFLWFLDINFFRINFVLKVSNQMVIISLL